MSNREFAAFTYISLHVCVSLKNPDLSKYKENENVNKYLDLAWELKKDVEHESNGDNNCSWCHWSGPQKPRGSPRWVVANVFDCDIVVSEFEQ